MLLTMACSILLSMATTLAPEELQDKHKITQDYKCTSQYQGGWRGCDREGGRARESGNGVGQNKNICNPCAKKQNPQKRRKLHSDGGEISLIPSRTVTYCRGGPMRSPCRARMTGTIWRNSLTGKHRDPLPPRSTAGSWQPGRRPPVSGSSGGPGQPTPATAAAAAAPPHGAFSACPVLSVYPRHDEERPEAACSRRSCNTKTGTLALRLNTQRPPLLHYS